MPRKAVSIPFRGKKRDRKPKPADAKTYIPSLDIITELEDNYDGYRIGDDGASLSLKNFAACADRSIDRVRVHVVANVKPSISVTLECCLQLGLEALDANQVVRDLVKINDDTIPSMESIDHDMYDQVCDIKDSTKVQLTTGRKVATIRTSTSSRCGKLAKDLGINKMDLQSIAIMIALIGQAKLRKDILIGGHLKEMEDQVAKFYTRIGNKLKIMNSIVDGLLRDAKG
jgi:hypothetical protein